MDDLNMICARAMMEEMEYGLFDETDLAIDVISGKFDDDEEKGEIDDGETKVLHGKKSMSEGKISNFFNRSKEKVDSISTDEANKVILPVLRSIIDKYNSDPKVRDKGVKLLSSYLKRIDEDSKDSKRIKVYVESNSIPKFKCKLAEKDKSSLIYEVLSGDQYIRDALSSLVKDIAKELKKNSDCSKIIRSIDTGDGDEGCIYIDI